VVTPLTRASVVIPTYNKSAYLALTLASFERQTATDFEIVVVDDGSSDDTGEVLTRFAGRLPLRHQRQTNRGRSAARNAAVQAAVGEILVFSDDDRIASPDYVAAHLAHHQDTGPAKIVYGWQHGMMTSWRRDVHPPAQVLWKQLARAAIGDIAHLDGPVALVSEDDVRDRLPQTVERFGYDEWWWQFVLPVALAYGDNLKGFDIPWALGTTGNLSVPRAPLLDVGGFDETYRGWGIEDLDICHRLHLAGLTTHIGRQAINWHQAHPHSPGKWGDWMRNLKLLLAKNTDLDITLYVVECTGPRLMSYVDLNEKLLAMKREKPTPALTDALRTACRQLIEHRMTSLEGSGALRFLGWSHDDWW